MCQIPPRITPEEVGSIPVCSDLPPIWFQIEYQGEGRVTDHKKAMSVEGACLAPVTIPMF